MTSETGSKQCGFANRSRPTQIGTPFDPLCCRILFKDLGKEGRKQLEGQFDTLDFKFLVAWHIIILPHRHPNHRRVVVV